MEHTARIELTTIVMVYKKKSLILVLQQSFSELAVTTPWWLAKRSKEEVQY